MSPQIRPLIAGLAGPGLLWLATSVASGQAAPAPQGPPNPAPTSSVTYQALLLSNGKVVRGEIVEDDAAGVFHHRQRAGTVPYPRAMVQKAAGSVEELYRFQVVRLPLGDPDERMKLARWCLTEHLPAQAKEQLLAIRQISPNDANVKRMLYNLDATAGRSGVDTEVRRTSGEMPADDQPAALDPRALATVKNRFNAVPVIFDLPPAQAVMRAREFTTHVQPVLLQSCVKCHNEKYQGIFQLVEIKNNRDLRNPDIPRANLDAALRLVNPDDPARSDILSAGLVPHGGNKNAIFRGPNDQHYQLLATWVKSLKPAGSAARAPTNPVTRTGYARPDTNPGEGFAADRPGRSAGSGAPAPLPQSPAPRAGLPPLPDSNFAAEATAATPRPPSRQIVERYEEDAEFRLKAGDNPEFPTPFAVGGAPPTRPAATAARPAGSQPAGTAPSTPPTVTPKTATQVAPGVVAVGPADDPNLLPGMNQPLYPTSAESDPAKKPARKIDPALLEKMIKNRNSTP